MVDEEMRDRVVSGGTSASPSPTRKPYLQSSNVKMDFSAGASDSRFLTDPKVRRKALSQRPEVIDITEVQAEPSHVLTTQEQIDTLNAIIDYNKSLPLRRRAKDSLPEIATHNVVKILREKKDYKKDKTELQPFYKPIGVID